MEANGDGQFLVLTHEAEGEFDTWLETAEEVVDALRNLGAHELLR